MALQTLKDRLDRIPPASVRVQRAVGIATVVTQSLIAVTGSVVRVTGSGLGCSEWPNCLPGSMVPVEHPEYAMLNQWIEFGNRLLTGLVGVVAIAAFVLAYLDRPRRARYVRLALVMPVGVAIQGIIGGVTVRLDLLWWIVAVHLLASMLMIWLATLYLNAIDEGPGPAVPRGPAVLGRLLPVLAGVLVGLLVVGTMVTGAGPHAGDPATPRLDLPVDVLSHVHAAFLYVFLALLVAVGVILRRTGDTPALLWRRYAVLVVVVLAQGALGFTQYFTGVPEVLVSLHVLGATVVIWATANLWAGAWERPAVVREGERVTVPA
ncbi:COX15/CtaA family protein [Actinokineospora pegani]|uniref:COX15/CtaA family protein n=1 Tax=Actinokineospora pegani TaxID=2654637 RepID=UPI0012E99386|nr:COX15/CtaA family protein [Actinokineospora pegani]